MGGGVQVGCGAGWRPVPTEPPPASRALWETAQLGKRRRGTPRQIPGHFAFVRGYTGFLEAWKARNYGALGSYFPNFTNRTPGAQAGEAREPCPPHPIEGYEIEEIVRPAAAVANQR